MPGTTGTDPRDDPREARQSRAVRDASAASPPPKPSLLRRIVKAYWSSDTAVMLSLAAVVGLAAGFAAVGFVKAIEYVTRFFFAGGRDLLSFMGHWYVLVIPAAGGLLVGPLVHFLAPEAKGHGVPEVMLAISKNGGRMRPAVIAVKAVGSALTIGSGGSVGREGPIVQIGAAVGSVLAQRLRLTERRTLALVGAGAAAGIAATFNAPIAGVMFALEVLMGAYSIRAVGTMVFSSVSAAAVSRFFLGDDPAFTVPPHALLSAWELPMYAGLGIVCALAAGVFVRVLYFSEDVFAAWKIPGWLKPAVGGLAIGLLGFFVPQIFGTGFAVINGILSSEYLPYFLILLVAAKIVATSTTLGSGASGGVFAPSLFIGAAVGSAYGAAMHELFPTVVAGSGAYAAVGMAAVFAAAARAPITAIVMLFELTLDYGIMLPVMLATVVAAAAANWAEPESIYTLKLVRRGIDFAAERTQRALGRTTVAEVMTPLHEVMALTLQTSLSEALQVFQETEEHASPVLDEEGRLVGIVTISDIEHAAVDVATETVVGDACTRNLVYAFQEEPVTRALSRAGKAGVHRMPVVRAADRSQLVGMLTSADLVLAYNRLFASRR